MKKGRFYIRMKNGSFQEVEGKVGEFFGTTFGCHKDYYDGYVITHIRTGTRVLHEKKMKDATDAITEELCEKMKKRMKEDPKYFNKLAKEMDKMYKDNPIGEVEK